ncbi:MAG: glycoside hydrolase family 1 protein [Candidatus Buchananbacteria bacterium CG10_big_fil_rev_8_21_14_0_10_42_9]|uniref:Glycoside hydrolase family 1 protein n=1 Tax=Candidatus Buchananbacteria bacterium CG10_big_fil_rev_8_21_14_0_10_42_9 TaxID=1974526 RepID=A0A2H0W2H1_9BACT|nr:MAG: glycoside hydrolase family 1 protein [Candidatus Buchananbacteria bacterium CG10_big_fil_rev_8_21_14_0_10_42_9]
MREKEFTRHTLTSGQNSVVRQLPPHGNLRFPPNFLWGTATAAHQIEGNNIYNDWWEWEQIANHIENNDKSRRASNHYELYETDYSYINRMHNNAYRFSIEWSRLEPKEGEWDQKAADHYLDQLKSLKAKGITVMVTLHHFTLPRWLARQGGFKAPQSVDLFSRYVKFCAEEFGEYVDCWVTFNEPLVYLTQGYMVGVWPPGESSWSSLFRVAKNLRRSHISAYKIIHSILDRPSRKSQVGVAKNIISVFLYRKYNVIDIIVSRLISWNWNHSFLWATKKYHDYLGLNYYFHYRLEKSHWKTWQFFVDVRREHREMSDVGWEIYPPGIFSALLEFKKYRKPIYITENGIATRDESRRSRYLVSHLKEIYHAIYAGVDIRGYFYWSLIDNFEWEEGFHPRFGLIGVNYKTFEREFRDTAKVYREIAKNNMIPHRLLKLLGHAVAFEI